MSSEPFGEAFVLWLDADARSGELRGALEHVPTARRERFDSGEALVRLLAKVRSAPERDLGGCRPACEVADPAPGSPGSPRPGGLER